MKRVTAILLSLFLAFGGIQVFARSYNEYKNGDVNMDKNLTIKDATLIQRHIVHLVTLTDEQAQLADTNLDGMVNIMDVTKIQKVVAQIEEMPIEDTTQPTSPTSTEPQTTTQEPTTLPTETQTITQELTTVPTETQTATQTEATAPNPAVKSKIDIYFTNNRKWPNVYFFLYNSQTGDGEKAWPGTQITKYTTNDLGEKTYFSTVDVDKYDRIIFNDGSNQQTVNIPVNKASSGFFISDSSNSKGMLVGTYANTGADRGKITKTYLKYPSGYNKKIWIWTPADYKASSADKFKTVYIMDGQNLFDEDHSDGYGGWEVTDAVESMMSNGARGVIIVGIDNGNSKRDSELTPDLGKVIPSYANEFSSRTGKQFSEFVVNTVMPYVQENYNSSPARVDNSIVGSSSGGLEAFYIGLENKDEFGSIGALSPAFLLFDSNVWNSYLAKFDFTAEDIPKLYIYNGNVGLENELYPDVISMNKRLLSGGYSPDKIKLSIEENGEHNEAWWRIVFPEFLSWGILR